MTAARRPILGIMSARARVQAFLSGSLGDFCPPDKTL